MRTYGDLIRDAALRHAERWKEGEEFKIHTSMQGIALEVILRAVFGVQSVDEAERFGEAVTNGLDAAHPVPFFFKSLQREFGGFGPWARFAREKRRLDAILHAHLATRRRAIARGDAPGDDVLSQMLTAEFDDGSVMSDDDICSQLLTLLVAGHETTATTLSWIFYELHRHPETLRLAREEIATLGADPDAAEYVKLPTLRAIADETLRLHPIIGEALRTVKKSFRFQGYDIPPGITVATSIIMIHTDPELYPEPAEFRPGRFLERRHGPSEHLPFGGGHRRCIGDAFALNEIAVVLGTLLPRYELELAVDRELKMVRRNVTMAPEAGVPMRLVGRRA
jgi:cytochrome P450